MVNPYQMLGGDAGVRALCEAFYEIMDTLQEATGIRRMHGQDLGPITEKLYEYLSGWLGGPELYLKRHGTICMTAPHKPYAIGPQERDQWLLCMNLALEKVGASQDVKEMLKLPLERVASAVQNRHAAPAEPAAATACTGSNSVATCQPG